MSELGDRIDDIHNRYRARFAGYPRITRDPDDLEALLNEAVALEAEASASMSPDERDTLARNRTVYQDELVGIREARAQGPAALQAHRLQTWANFIQARYARYFAAQRRATRDLGILAEMVDDADRVLGDMRALFNSAPTPELGQAIEVTRNNLEIYRAEIPRIREDRKRVFGAERATQFAGLANAQFQRYRLHFANKSRLSRNPDLLDHIIGALQEVLDGMLALRADGFDTEAHRGNIALVQQNLGVYREEVTKVRDLRGKAPLDQRVGELGAAANEVFKVYRENFAGKSRNTRDVGLLADQIELLLQVVRQMDAIDRDDGDDANERNLGLVMDMLHLYHREYALVQEQQKKEATAN